MLRVVKKMVNQGPLILAGLFLGVISSIIFQEIQDDTKTKYYGDEQTHVPRGEAFCQLEFSKFEMQEPGMYIVSAVFLAPFQLCSAYYLRLTSLLCSIVNFFLYHKIFEVVFPTNNYYFNIFSAFNISLFPIIFVFKNLYYPDIFSLTMVTAMYLLHRQSYHYKAFVFGFLAILTAQNNIAFVAVLLARLYLIEVYCLVCNPDFNFPFIPDRKFPNVILKLICNIMAPIKTRRLRFWLNAAPYLTLILGYTSYLTSRTDFNEVEYYELASQYATRLHQIFDFTLFSFLFTSSLCISEVFHFIPFVWKRKFATLILLLLAAIAIYTRQHVMEIHFFTRTDIVETTGNSKYLMVPIYAATFFSICRKLYFCSDPAFSFMYAIAVFILLLTKNVFDYQQFLIPFVLYRVHFRHPDYFELLMELILYLSIDRGLYLKFFEETSFLAWIYSQIFT